MSQNKLLYKVLPFIIIFFFICCLTSSVLAKEQNRDFFKVGVISSFSGSLSKGGLIMKRGYGLWADVVNEQGGIEVNGTKYKVKIIFRDAASDPAKAAQVAEKLIVDDKVDFILGPYSSMVTLGAAPIIEKYKVPHITGSAESDLIWQRHFDWSFQLLAPCNRGARGGVRAAAAQSPKPETAAIITADDAFSISGAKGMREEAEKKGMKVLLYEVFPVDTTEFSSLITKVKAKNPDVFLFSGHPEHHMAGLKVAKALGFKPKAKAIHWLSGDIWRELGKKADGVMGITMWTKDMPYEGPVFGTASAYAQKFKDVYGHEPDYTEAGSAGAGVVFQTALQKAGLTPPLDAKKREKLKTTLEKINIENTFFGSVNFVTEEKFWHSNIGIELIVLQVQNGEPVAVFPAETTQGDVIYPSP